MIQWISRNFVFYWNPRLFWSGTSVLYIAPKPTKNHPWRRCISYISITPKNFHALDEQTRHMYTKMWWMQRQPRTMSPVHTRTPVVIFVHCVAWHGSGGKSKCSYPCFIYRPASVTVHRSVPYIFRIWFQRRSDANRAQAKYYFGKETGHCHHWWSNGRHATRAGCTYYLHRNEYYWQDDCIARSKKLPFLGVLGHLCQK